MGQALHAPLYGPLWQKVGALGLIVAAGGAIYGGLALATGAMRLSDLSTLRRRQSTAA
jgi:hypothetical protein